MRLAEAVRPLLCCNDVKGSDIVNIGAGRLPAKLAVLGLVMAALSLSACGRKGPLDPPPGAALPAPPVAAALSGDAATPASKQRSALDWLID